MMMRVFRLLLLLVFAGTVQAGPETLAQDQVLHRGNGPEPETLDPAKANGVQTANVLLDLYQGLTAEAPDGAIVPGVAQSWEVSDDKKTYTFHLRDNARWSNGDPVTAQDFVASMRRSADPALRNLSLRMGLMKAAGAALVGGAAIIWIALTS